jgi:acetyltransferase-like isoleucine patch superfamily enzyme
MSHAEFRTFEDPFTWTTRLANKLHSIWIKWTYPFFALGNKVRIHHTCDLKRSIAPWLKIGNSVILDRDIWLNIPVVPSNAEPVIVIEDGCALGRRCVISAKNRVHIERNAIFAPSVLIMDHNHAFGDVNAPIANQGITAGGTIRIEEGCWIGFGVAVICDKGELVIGKNSVIGANSLLTRSVPPNSVVSGNPGRVVKQFDPVRGDWVLGTVKSAVPVEPIKV